MKLYNVDEFQELNCTAKDYWSLINFFSKISEDFYSQHNIYTENHHIYPIGETITEIPITIKLPFKYHFLAHYYRAKESTFTLGKKVNYNACQIIIGHSKHISEVAKSFPNELYEMKQKLLEYPRNVKPIINLQTLRIYKSSREAQEYEHIDYHFIIKICIKKEDYYKNSCYKTRYFEYYDESKPLEYYKKLYEHYSSIPKRKKKAWREEDIKKRAESMRGTRFVQKKTKPIIDLQTNTIYKSIQEVLDEKVYFKKAIYGSLKDKAPHFSNYHICNFRYLEDKDINLPYTQYLDTSNSNRFNLSLKILKVLYNLPKIEGSYITIFNNYFPSILWLSKRSGISRSSLNLFKGIYF